MPKEIVHGQCPVFGPDSMAEPIIEVRWSRDKDFVEIGSRIVHMADHTDYVPTEEERPSMGTSEGRAIRGLYMSLERSEINSLIRNLRRARDQAFGRDE